MPKSLEDLVVDEVSLVDVPANKGARVILLKRGGDARVDDKKTLLEKLKKALGLDTASGSNEDLNIGDSDVKIEEKLAALEAQVTKLSADKALSDFSARIAKAKTPADLSTIEADAGFKALGDEARKALSTEIEARKGEFADQARSGRYSEFKTNLPKSLAKAFDEMDDDDKKEFMGRFGKAGEKDPVGKALEAATKRADVLQAQVDALVEKSELDSIKKDLGDLAKGDDADELAKSIRSLRKADPAAAEAMVKRMKAQAAQLKAAGLFKTIGKDGGEDQAADDKIEKLAKARAAKDGISVAQATDLVLRENPGLYDASLEEKNAE